MKKKSKTANVNSPSNAKEAIEVEKEKADIGEVIYSVKGTMKKVEKVKVSSTEEYFRGIRNLQIMAITTVFIITAISPLRLLESRTTFDLTAV